MSIKWSFTIFHFAGGAGGARVRAGHGCLHNVRPVCAPVGRRGVVWRRMIHCYGADTRRSPAKTLRCDIDFLVFYILPCRRASLQNGDAKNRVTPQVFAVVHQAAKLPLASPPPLEREVKPLLCCTSAWRRGKMPRLPVKRRANRLRAPRRHGFDTQIYFALVIRGPSRHLPSKNRETAAHYIEVLV